MHAVTTCQQPTFDPPPPVTMIRTYTARNVQFVTGLLQACYNLLNQVNIRCVRMACISLLRQVGCKLSLAASCHLLQVVTCCKLSLAASCSHQTWLKLLAGLSQPVNRLAASCSVRLVKLVIHSLLQVVSTSCNKSAKLTTCNKVRYNFQVSVHATQLSWRRAWPKGGRLWYHGRSQRSNVLQTDNQLLKARSLCHPWAHQQSLESVSIQWSTSWLTEGDLGVSSSNVWWKSLSKVRVYGFSLNWKKLARARNVW